MCTCVVHLYGCQKKNFHDDHTINIFIFHSHISLSLSLSLSLSPVDLRRLQDYYEFGETIGNGGFGAVYAGTSLLSGNPVSACTCTCCVLMYPFIYPPSL